MPSKLASRAKLNRESLLPGIAEGAGAGKFVGGFRLAVDVTGIGENSSSGGSPPKFLGEFDSGCSYKSLKAIRNQASICSML